MTESATKELTSASALDLYAVMYRIRRFEENAGKLLREGRIPGFIHLSIGQEAVAAGVCSVLGNRDYISTTHRGHGHCLAKGGRVDRMFAELFGKPEGYCRGRSGSMHIANAEIGILGANAIVAGGLPMAVGAAFAAQVAESGGVAVAFFGEGAAAEGVFHECLNLSSLWNLPVIFVCENNQYAELSHVSVHLSAGGVADFGPSYRIPAETIDGNDVMAVRNAAALAVDRAREGGGPSLLEFSTYRWGGHFEGDPQRYRDNAEVEEWKRRDPLLLYKLRLEEEFSTTAAEILALEREAESDIARAVEWAEELSESPLELLVDDVYRNPSQWSGDKCHK